MSGKYFRDLTGERFGELVVLKRAGTSKDRHIIWECKCDCGEICYVQSNSLTSGKTKSCGCRKKEIGDRRRTHNMSCTRIYTTWQGMRNRCLKETHKNYKQYGARGIKVCEEWNRSFQSFYDYVSVLPHFGEKGYSLDRINNDGNYEPGNVKWSTHKEQCNNRRQRRKTVCGN